jgi:Flp pilus assembly protein TadB
MRAVGKNILEERKAAERLADARKPTLEERKAAEKADETLGGCVSLLMLVVVVAVCLVMAIVIDMLMGPSATYVVWFIFLAVGIFALALIVRWLRS